MRKFSYLVLILALVLPLAIPFAAFAQDDDPVMDALVAFNSNLPAGWGGVSVDDLNVELIDNPDLLLVDVRSAVDYDEGHLEGAINIPLRELAQNLDLLPDLDEPMVIYCGSGWRSVLGMVSLQVLGYTDVRSMSSGIAAWTGAEYPVVTDPFVVEPGEAPAIDPDVLAAVDAELAGLPDTWGGVGAEDLNVEMIDNPPDVIIDVRTVKEWTENGYIAGAVLMPVEELTSFAADWPKDLDANIVVYCAKGTRGNFAATMLRIAGYTNVRNLKGGFAAWADAELPVEMPEEMAAAGDPVMDALVAFNSNLPAGWGGVSVDDLNVELIDNPDLLLVDVRSAVDYDEGHLEGAINIPLRELAQNLDLLPDLDEPMVIYCGSGWRSVLGMVSLQVLGYTDVRSMSSGIAAWTGAEYPVVTDPFVVEPGEAPAIDPDVLAAVDAELAGLPDTWGGVGAEDLNVEMIDNPPDVIIDVRTVKEWTENGYIAGAVLMPVEELTSFAADWPKDLDANIVVYCAKGTRGNFAATMLRIAGYTNVRNLKGGFAAWADAELPVEMPE